MAADCRAVRTPYGARLYSCTDDGRHADRARRRADGRRQPRSSPPRCGSPTPRGSRRSRCGGSPTSSASATMTPYTHVESKDELLDLMRDAVAAEMLLPEPLPDDWRAALRAIAHHTRAPSKPTPGASTPPPAGPRARINRLRHVEQSVGIVVRLGVDPQTGRAVLMSIDDYVIGHCPREQLRREADRSARAIWRRAPRAGEEPLALDRRPPRSAPPPIDVRRHLPTPVEPTSRLPRRASRPPACRRRAPSFDEPRPRCRRRSNGDRSGRRCGARRPASGVLRRVPSAHRRRRARRRGRLALDRRQARCADAHAAEARGASPPVEARGAEAVGALAIGALAVGAAAVGGFAIGRLSVRPPEGRRGDVRPARDRGAASTSSRSAS